MQSVLRVTIGVLLCLAAVAKGAEFDRLELYIFSFGWFGLGVSFWLARLLVAAELVVGLALVLGIRRRATTLAALAMTLMFSAFLGYALLTGRNDNCHCLGELVEMSPAMSLLKNGALAIALLLILPQRGGTRIRDRWVAVGAAIITIGTFIYSPPDNINPHRTYDEVVDRAMFDTLATADGRRMVCMYSTSCPYCELASSKIGSIIRRHKLSNTEVWFADFGRLNDSIVSAFYERTLSPTLPYRALPIGTFLRLTDGEMPVVLLVDGDSVVHQYNYRTIDEATILQFLSNKD